jgi:hypothetical protein
MASDRKHGFREKIWLQTENMASDRQYGFRQNTSRCNAIYGFCESLLLLVLIEHLRYEGQQFLILNTKLLSAIIRVGHILTIWRKGLVISVHNNLVFNIKNCCPSYLRCSIWNLSSPGDFYNFKDLTPVSTSSKENVCLVYDSQFYLKYYYGALLCSFYNILEKIIFRRIQYWIETFSIIFQNKQQQGFTESINCITTTCILSEAILSV